MRKTFATELVKQAKQNPDIMLLTGDLGYGMWDQFRKELPQQFINCGASEQAMMGIAVGLALSGKIPFVYSITPFLLYRPLETIRTYINHEKINVKLIGSGRDTDYLHDGISHWSHDIYPLFDHEQGPILDNIQTYWPDKNEEIPEIVNKMITSPQPAFLSLRR